MRMRHKPWAEDYLKSHSDIVDIDGSRLWAYPRMV